MLTTPSTAPVILFTTPTCPDCRHLKGWLDEHGIAYLERDLSDPAVSAEARDRYGVRVAPIAVLGTHVMYGTFADLKARLEQALGVGAH